MALQKSVINRSGHTNTYHRITRYSYVAKTPSGDKARIIVEYESYATKEARDNGTPADCKNVWQKETTAPEPSGRSECYTALKAEGAPLHESEDV